MDLNIYTLANHPATVTRQLTKSMDFRQKKNLDSYCTFVTFGLFIFEKNAVNVPYLQKVMSRKTFFLD
jgi:hypothetical protein